MGGCDKKKSQKIRKLLVKNVYYVLPVLFDQKSKVDGSLKFIIAIEKLKTKLQN